MEIPNLSVISTEVNQRVHIKLSRQSALNSLSVDMLSLISQYARKANQENKHMIFTGQGRAFCAGGDVVSIVKGTTSPEALFGSEFGLFYYLSEMKTERIAIMDGIVMGGGVGLSMCCSLRVATPKTN